MTSLSVSQEAFENALVAKYSGFYLSVAGVPTEVKVFLEKPSNENESNRTFPSVSIMYLGESEDTEVQESSDEDPEEVGLDGTVNPNERIMRGSSDPIVMRYSIDTWHKDMAAEDQVLYHEMFRRRTKNKGYIRVLNIDGEYLDIWLFKVNGSLSVHDYDDVDTVIYHKSIMVEALAYLTEVEYDETVREKVVNEVHWDVKSRETTLDERGLVGEVDDSENVTDVVIRVTEDTEEVLS
jgi:hypothetical protein